MVGKEVTKDNIKDTTQKFVVLISPLNLQMLKEEERTIKPIVHKRQKQSFMLIGSK